LYASKYIPEKYLRLGGIHKIPYIFTRIYLDEEYNYYCNLGISLILHPKILKEEPSIYNLGWYAHLTKKSTFLNMDDVNINKKNKLYFK